MQRPVGFSSGDRFYLSIFLTAVFLFLAMVLAGPARAAATSAENGPEQIDAVNANDTSWSNAYLLPNEQHPQLAAPIYGESGRGILLGTGFFRMLVALAMAPNSKGAIIVDYNAEVIAFYRLFRMAFQLSATARDFRNFLTNLADEPPARWAAQFSGVAEANDFLILNERTSGLLKRDLKPVLQKLFRRTYFTQQAFHGVNPFMREDLYQSVRQRIMNGELDVFHGNFADSNLQQRIVERVAERHSFISIVDMSNILAGRYLTENQFTKLSEALQPVLTENSIWVFTRTEEFHLGHLFGLRSAWNYTALTHKQLRSHSGIELLKSQRADRLMSHSPQDSALRCDDLLN